MACCRTWTTGLLALLVVACASAQAGAQTEVREFSVQVDGKPAGQYTMTITKHDDGSESMSGQATVRVKHVLGTYTFTYQGVERWKGGRLVELKSSSNDNGKRFTVSAAAEGNVLRVNVNGAVRQLSGDSWTTTYWRLADARFHNQSVPLLDADTGKEMSGRLQYVGVEEVNLGSQAQKCYHFRVSGPAAADLWFDGSQRLVREDMTVDGHRSVFHLTGLKR
ncbi:MAG TPA: DUF6134 family protein [Gemmataceae bacterium]|nr:DUF6134 family protein [Gemmataceae bacterium]